jgi:hypothetical protein
MDSDTKNLSYLREEVWSMLLVEVEQNLTVGICCEYHIRVSLLKLLPYSTQNSSIIFLKSSARSPNFSCAT